MNYVILLLKSITGKLKNPKLFSFFKISFRGIMKSLPKFILSSSMLIICISLSCSRSGVQPVGVKYSPNQLNTEQKNHVMEFGTVASSAVKALERVNVFLSELDYENAWLEAIRTVISYPHEAFAYEPRKTVVM